MHVMAQQLLIQLLTYKGVIIDPPIQNSHEEMVSEPVIQEPQQVVQTAPQTTGPIRLKKILKSQKVGHSI